MEALQYHQLLSAYASASDWFLHCENHLRSSINKLEIRQIIETCEKYLNTIMHLENTEYSIILLQIQNALNKMKLNLEAKSAPHEANSNLNDRIEKDIQGTKLKPQCNGLADIAGYTEAKNQLKTIVVLPKKQPQLFVTNNLTKTILLYGPPGTGKTQIAHALAAEVNANIYCVTASTLMSPYSGETEKSIEVLFMMMRNITEPTFLFIDEIDGLCRKRHGLETDHNRRIKTEIMCHLTRFNQNTNVLLICATNCPWDLDTAFIRRFQKRLYIPLPNKKDRTELLAMFTKNTTLHATYPFWDKLLDITDGYSASDLKDLVGYALTRPISELTEVNIWKCVDGKCYVPWSNVGFTENLLFCTLDELPDESVQARDVTFDDLMKSTQVVQKTVPQSEIEKFSTYTMNSH